MKIFPNSFLKIIGCLPYLLPVSSLARTGAAAAQRPLKSGDGHRIEEGRLKVKFRQKGKASPGGLMEGSPGKGKIPIFVIHPINDFPQGRQSI